MIIKPPKIDARSPEDLLREIKSLVPFYTPEWEPSEGDPGLALINILAYMLETIIQRLNRVPEKNFIAFLDKIGTKLLPAQPARVPLTFVLSEGTTESIRVPERTQAAAGEIVFETEKEILAAPCKLVHAYSISVEKDAIYESPSHVREGKAVSPLSAHLAYAATRQQDSTLFLDNASGLAKGDFIKIDDPERTEYAVVSEVSDTRISLTDKLQRDHRAGTCVKKATAFELFEGKNLQEHALYLGHIELFNIKASIDGESEVTLEFDVSEQVRSLPSLEWSYWGKEDTTKQQRWIPITPKPDFSSWSIKRPYVDKKGQIILPISGEIAEKEVYGMKSRWIRCKLADFLPRDTELPAIDGISVKVDNTVKPDMAFYNDVPLDLENLSAQDPIYPFGKTPRLYDTFYIGSQEAFSKKGATITLKFTYEPAKSRLFECDRNACDPTNITQLKEVFLTYWISLSSKALVSEINETTWKVVDGSRVYPIKQVDNTLHVYHIPTPQLSWEYWNGKGWVALTKDFEDETDAFTAGNQAAATNNVMFSCPNDMKPANVNNQESHWIRVRIVGGDYGKEVEIDANGNPKKGVVVPPKITQLLIEYYFENELPLEPCLTYNNLEFRDVTEESRPDNRKSFKPFLPLEDSDQALYLGFDKKLEKGPISIFFWLEEQQYLEEDMPRVVWEYCAEREGEREWTRLMVLEETRNLTRSGTIQLVFPPNFVKSRRFGTEAYWIRAVNIENKFAAPLKAIAQSGEAFEDRKLHPRVMKDYILPATNSVIDRSERIEPCRGQLQVFHPAWSVLCEVGQYPPAPTIRGIHLNTTWAVQAETVEDEILGSSDGTKGQTFTSTKAPVISEEIWVNELSALSEGQRKDLLEEGEPKVNEVKDEKGNATEFWVKWQAVDDLLGSSKNNRDYEIDRTFGQIKFGDGTNGRIPPMGTDSIKANYTSGGGKKANVAVSEISTLSTSIPFVDKVCNPVAARGGSDTEVIENALERGPQIVRHRNRTVTEEDFEWLAKQASRNIVRAQCLANFDDRGEFRAGWVTVLAVPESKEDRPKLSLQLKSHLERYLKERCPSTIVPEQHLQVLEPVYVEVCVEATIASTTVDAVARIEKNAFSRLREFLHPLTGGHERKGWDFGRMPCLSDFFELLEKIPEVSHVETLLVRIRTDGEELVITPERSTDVEMPPYTLIYSGEHNVIVTYKGEV